MDAYFFHKSLVYKLHYNHFQALYWRNDWLVQVRSSLSSRLFCVCVHCECWEKHFNLIKQLTVPQKGNCLSYMRTLEKKMSVLFDIHPKESCWDTNLDLVIYNLRYFLKVVGNRKTKKVYHPCSKCKLRVWNPCIYLRDQSFILHCGTLVAGVQGFKTSTTACTITTCKITRLASTAHMFCL